MSRSWYKHPAKTTYIPYKERIAHSFWKCRWNFRHIGQMRAASAARAEKTIPIRPRTIPPHPWIVEYRMSGLTSPGNKQRFLRKQRRAARKLLQRRLDAEYFNAFYSTEP